MKKHMVLGGFAVAMGLMGCESDEQNACTQTWDTQETGRAVLQSSPSACSDSSDGTYPCVMAYVNGSPELTPAGLLEAAIGFDYLWGTQYDFDYEIAYPKYEGECSDTVDLVSAPRVTVVTMHSEVPDPEGTEYELNGLSVTNDWAIARANPDDSTEVGVPLYVLNLNPNYLFTCAADVDCEALDTIQGVIDLKFTHSDQNAPVELTWWN